jgi:hypothetical protein
MPDFFFGADARGAELEVRRRGVAFFVAPPDFWVAPVDFFVPLEALVLPVRLVGRLPELAFLVVAIVIPPGVPAGCG